MHGSEHRQLWVLITSLQSAPTPKISSSGPTVRAVARRGKCHSRGSPLVTRRENLLRSRSARPDCHMHCAVNYSEALVQAACRGHVSTCPLTRSRRERAIPCHAQIEVPRLSTLHKRQSSFARKSYSLTVSIVLSITRPVNRSIATWTQ